MVTGHGAIAAVKLDVKHEGTRYIDYLLLLRLKQGWRIVAAVWGDPLTR
jgi:Putative lumazine-binding